MTIPIWHDIETTAISFYLLMSILTTENPGKIKDLEINDAGHSFNNK